jgi:hypothetical protein
MQLKPCPFCGGPGKIIHRGSEYAPICQNKCVSFSHLFNHLGFTFKKDAAEVWNTRPTKQEKP